MADVVIECMRIFPDALVVGSGIYALLTQSMAYAILFGSLVEASLVFRLIKLFANYVNITGRIVPSTDSLMHKCRSGFQTPTPTLESLSMFGQEPLGVPFPSSPLFMLSTASSYVFTTLSKQRKELEALGPAYASRYYASAFFLLVLICLFMVFRISFNCESIGILVISSILGLIVGNLLVEQNVRLFGAQSINLVGVPLLRNRTADGKKLYVCPTTA